MHGYKNELVSQSSLTLLLSL